MSVLHLPNAHYKSLVSAHEDVLLGDQISWLNGLRKKAADQFSEIGFPSFREEEWRYTNVTPIEKNKFTVPRESGSVDEAFINSVLLEGCYHLVFVDGYFQPTYSTPVNDLPSGILVSALSQAITDNEALVKSLLDSVVETPALGFVSLNTALFSDGAIISIEENTAVEKPIQVAFISSKAGALTLSNTRNLIFAQAASTAHIIETYHGVEDECYLTNAITEVVVESNATLSHDRLQAESSNAYHIGGVYSRLDDKGVFKQSNYTFGASTSRCESHAILGEASDCTLNGLYVGEDRQHMDHHTRLNHAQPHATSHEYYKGILNDRSQGVFQGRIIVAQDAQKTDSKMNNRNLLLSDRAEVDTKPQLEIYADDVKCAHGVTVGQLDKTAVFYLRSRGADEQMAKNMLTFAFANEMVERIEFKPLRLAVLDELLERFPQTGMKKEWL